MATLAEVAAHAGVGIGTVSRVINASAQVSPEMRARVMSSIDAVGYAARPRRGGTESARSGFVGVLVPFFDTQSTYERLRGIVARLQPNDCEVILYNVQSPVQARERLSELPKSTLLDALVVISLRLANEDVATLQSAPFPTVLVDTEAHGLPSLCIDDRQGGYIATRHLLDLGHRRIAFVGEPHDNPFGFVSSAHREQGYRRAMESAGLAIDPTLIRYGAHLRSAARQMTLDLLSLAEPPTAIVAASDTQATGVLEAAQAMNVVVPDELSVVGYDDIEIASVMGLTTVRQPLERSGQRVADLALEAMNGKRRVGSAEVMELELVVRNTTRPIR